MNQSGDDKRLLEALCKEIKVSHKKIFKLQRLKRSLA